MKNKKFTVYAKRDNGIITTIYTYKTRQAALKAMRRFKNRYEHTNVKFIRIWIEETKGAAI